MKKNNKRLLWIFSLITIVAITLFISIKLGVLPSKEEQDNSINEISETNKIDDISPNYVNNDYYNPYADRTEFYEDPDVLAEDEEKIKEIFENEYFNFFDHSYQDDDYNTYESVLKNMPEYKGEQKVAINKSYAFINENDIKDGQFINYVELDNLGRTGVAYGVVGPETRNKNDRTQNLADVTPSGYFQVDVEEKYGIVFQPNDFPFLMTRSHLIAYALGGGELEPRDIIAGTYAFNNEMLKIERAIINYVDICEDRVIYRVTPVYNGSELIPRGVLMEAYDIESQGHYLNVCQYVFNNQPGFEIDYQNGGANIIR